MSQESACMLLLCEQLVARGVEVDLPPSKLLPDFQHLKHCSYTRECSYGAKAKFRTFGFAIRPVNFLARG
jgi:hypothetical protein